MNSKLLRRAAPEPPKDPKSLLTTNNSKTQKQYEPALVTTDNTKTEKGETEGYLTGIMHLSPSDISGYGNVCPSASPQCRHNCLNTAGTWVNTPQVQDARAARTRLYFQDRPKFLSDLRRSIEKLLREAKRKGLTPAIRINGTSDLPGVAKLMAKEYPEIQFYDYTAIPRPWMRTMPNYHITFSRKENNDKETMEALEHGVDAAVVFDIKKGEPLPPEWMGYPVIDGDKHDLRFLDKKEGKGPFVIGLRAKGKGRGTGSDSGFVINIQPAPKSASGTFGIPHIEFYEDEVFEVPCSDCHNE